MIWYPYQQMKPMQTPYEIVDAEGVYLYTRERRMIDSVSSWWSVIHGYKHPALNQVLVDQAGRFSHVMLGGLTHAPASSWRKLGQWLPGELAYSFFSDSGSVAVEVALKMALQYFMNRGQTQRTMILALEHAYHGDTFKTMEAGDDADYHFVLQAYGPSRHVGAHSHGDSGAGGGLSDPTMAPELSGGASPGGRRGMRHVWMHPFSSGPALCDQYGVLIFDEVATGFGRTGNRFVADLVQPDILVLGKALTGGYLGHAVTVASRKVYEGFYDDCPEHALMHGPTFMGNALACRLALQSIALFEEQDYLAKIRRMEQITRRELAGFSHPSIREIRIMGGCVCIEVFDPAVLRGYQQFAYERGCSAGRSCSISMPWCRTSLRKRSWSRCCVR